MKGLKFLVTCAAVGALACTFAAASFADDYTTTANYDAEDGTVTIGDLTDYAALVKGDMTLLILATDNPNVIITSENTSIIKQIQQAATFDSAEIPVGDLADGTYLVRIGGADVGANNSKGFIETTFEVGSSAPSYILGDVNSDTYIDMGDAAAILNHFTGDSIISDETALLAADVNKDTYVDMGDAAAILNHFTGDSLIEQ